MRNALILGGVGLVGCVFAWIWLMDRLDHALTIADFTQEDDQ